MAKGLYYFLLQGAATLQAATALILPQRPLAAPVLAAVDNTPLPLVIWHGLGDNYKADGLRSIGDLAEEVHPGTFVYYIRLDPDPNADSQATFFGNLNDQVAQVCADLATHPILSTAPAINALGFSQGGQFMRAYVERCNNPPVANLVTFGSQHNGIAEFQNCKPTDWVCKGSQALLRGSTWTEFVQTRLVPAQYFRKEEELEKYLENSNFLADVNNERKIKNTTYRENMMKLEKFVMFMFGDDTTVIPKESAFFSEVNATTGEVTKLQDRPIYKEDWLGLKVLDEQKKLDFLVTEGGHMQLSDKLLKDTFNKYFTRTTEDESDAEL
ncbi:hypothetical protein MMC30_006934 [Trapelia coarctata]|nr:hypothetical protein [Trapelia coarctata]